MHSRRALLYMPGDDWKKITKALTLGVDCICMDMEDGVAIHKKAEARATIAKALRELDFGKSEKLARINAVGSGMEKEDIEAVLPLSSGWHCDPQNGVAGTNSMGARDHRSRRIEEWLAAELDPHPGGCGDRQRDFEPKGNRLAPATRRIDLRRGGLRGLAGRNAHTGGARIALSRARLPSRRPRRSDCKPLISSRSISRISKP